MRPIEDYSASRNVWSQIARMYSQINTVFSQVISVLICENNQCYL